MNISSSPWYKIKMTRQCETQRRDMQNRCIGSSPRFYLETLFCPEPTGHVLYVHSGMRSTRPMLSNKQQQTCRSSIEVCSNGGRDWENVKLLHNLESSCSSSTTRDAIPLYVHLYSRSYLRAFLAFHFDHVIIIHQCSLPLFTILNPQLIRDLAVRQVSKIRHCLIQEEFESDETLHPFVCSVRCVTCSQPSMDVDLSFSRPTQHIRAPGEETPKI